MTDSVVTSPSGISEGSCVKLSIYRACVHRFQDKWTTLKHPPSNLQLQESVCVILCAQLKICCRQDKTRPPRHHFPKFNPSLLHPLVHPPSSPPARPSHFPAPSLTVQPAHWLCCPSPGASWRQGALGEWRKTRPSAAQMNHLGERQRGRERERERERERKWQSWDGRARRYVI